MVGPGESRKKQATIFIFPPGIPRLVEKDMEIENHNLNQ